MNGSLSRIGGERRMTEKKIKAVINGIIMEHPDADAAWDDGPGKHPGDPHRKPPPPHRPTPPPKPTKPGRKRRKPGDPPETPPSNRLSRMERYSQCF
jgi:hypothetical protein